MATLIEKIIRRNNGNERAKAGDIVTVRADRVMIHDIFIPFAADKFHEMGFTKVWDPEKIVLIYDHLVPASQIDDTRHFRLGDAFAAEQQLVHVHRSDGICHQLMPELHYAGPGDVVFGTDSHTTTYGACGAFSTGIGYTEMAAILGTGELWVRVPETIRVQIDGELPEGVSSKDIILTVLGDISASGAAYQSLEFGGSCIGSLSMASRLTISNMAVEAGAKCGLCYADEKTAEFCAKEMSPEKGFFEDDFILPDNAAAVWEEKTSVSGNSYREAQGKAGSGFSRYLYYRAESFVPVMACPSRVDNIVPAASAAGQKVDQVFIGSCTNGRLEDLRAAADVLRGKKIAQYMRLIVTPASRSIYEAADAEGILDTLLKAGAVVTHPGCGLCCGRTGGILADNEVVVATNNRNFLGRMGSSAVKIYLASPETAALCALKGEITAPPGC